MRRWLNSIKLYFVSEGKKKKKVSLHVLSLKFELVRGWLALRW